MWKALRHPNVVPLIGVAMSETRFAMISEWMVNRDINNFLKGNPDADRLKLVCFPLLTSPHHLSDRLLNNLRS